MHANHVELSWDANKKDWVVRIQAGEEVIRRHCKIPADADDNTLLSAAQKTVRDEGYEIDSGAIIIKR